MPRASTRQKPSGSQSQSQPETGGRSQPSHRRRRLTTEDDEDDEDGRQDEDEEMEDEEDGSEEKTVERKANDLVRLSLFTEYRRSVLKRDEIAKKVLGGRALKGDFQPVFDRAQQILRQTFGMELHEIMSRAERDRADATREGALGQDGESAMTGAKKKASTASSKQYMLRSVLDNTIIEAASVYDVEIDDAERADLELWHPNQDEFRSEGTLLAWKHGDVDQLGMAGVLHVILALILVNGRMLTDMQLRTYLKRLRLPMGSAMPTNSVSQTTKPLTIDAYLAILVKQLYLDKQKTSLASTQGGQKRGRGAADDGDASYEWKWGTRAIAEIGEKGIGGFVVDFMEGIERERENRKAEDEEGVQGHGKREREQMEKRKEKLFTAIGRAAGGALVSHK
ncbi:hypothetical protein K439DRAFT_1392966 [Ramaria rubella]|nr:hypothetical protein K439DRAFT_1392966 [Ramaria rubella]